MKFEIKVNEKRKSFILTVIFPSIIWFPKYEEMLRILMALRAVEEINKQVEFWIRSSLPSRDLYDVIEDTIKKWSPDLKTFDFFHHVKRWRK